jgi:hypothetical protein
MELALQNAMKTAQEGLKIGGGDEKIGGNMKPVEIEGGDEKIGGNMKIEAIWEAIWEAVWVNLMKKSRFEIEEGSSGSTAEKSIVVKGGENDDTIEQSRRRWKVAEAVHRESSAAVTVYT